jgi:hypothetical protein
LELRGGAFLLALSGQPGNIFQAAATFSGCFSAAARRRKKQNRYP